MKGTSILVIGDVHLGTACSGVPDEISSWGLDSGELAPAATLKLSVDFAIENHLDAVLFAGDVVESTNARFEAMLPLEESIRRLLDAGIQVIAVAGNHDVEALPRLAALIDGFTLLGAGGQWEANVILKNQSPVAQVIGWSFGERFVRQSPVAQLLAQPLETPSPLVPRIGLLHADLDASGGHYAPIRQTELDDIGYDAWLLGHIHKPSLERLSSSTDSRPSGYLGSLVGLDPLETGPHGPWLLRISNGGDLHLEQVALAPLRWEHLLVSIDGLEHVEDVPDRLLGRSGEICPRAWRGWHPTPCARSARTAHRDKYSIRGNPTTDCYRRMGTVKLTGLAILLPRTHCPRAFSLGTSHLSPVGKRSGSKESIVDRFEMMPANSEQVLNRTMDREKPLDVCH